MRIADPRPAARQPEHPSRTMIPLIDLRAQYRAIRPEVDTAVRRVLDSGQYILGPEVEAFEREMAAYCRMRHAAAVASGTDALALSLRACGIGPGDEVITTAFSFFATAEAILAVGAIPVFVDIDASTYQMDPAAARAAVTRRTKALLPVHLYGHPVRMDEVCALAKRHRLRVIEDCAQAVGAEWGGQRVGGFGDAGCFSFYPSKNLGAYGDGGMVVTNDARLADTVRLLRAHGSRARYAHVRVGTNSRLDELQAAVLRVKLRHLNAWTAARRRLAQAYRAAFERERVLEVRVPLAHPDAKPVYHLYVVQTPRRARVQAALHRAGIATQVAYPSILPDQPALRGLRLRAVSCAVARAAAARVLALPVYPELPPRTVETIARTIGRALRA